MCRLLIGFIAVVLLTTKPAGAQWIGSVPTDPATPVKTGSFMAIGPGVTPYTDTSLRLGIPAGSPSCAGTPTPSTGRCLQLAFGTDGGQYWGLRLDANRNLHFDRYYAAWLEGVVFGRSGDVAIHGGTKALRIDGANTGGFGIEVRDLYPYYQTGMVLDLEGNSFITVSGLQLGNLSTPVVRSNSYTEPLYLNLWTPTDVVIGDPDPFYNNMGLRVDSYGKSTFRGSVGIGTTTPNPAYRLDVAGDAHFSGTVTGGNIQAKYQDLAEWVPSMTGLAPGTIVVIDPAHSNHVVASSRPYDTSVAGVVSSRPGIVLGEAGDSKTLIATTGRVRIRVDASRQPVAIGDLLVTGEKPGVAMKSIPIDLQGIAFHRPGTLVGKALEPLDRGEGEILVLLSLQ